MDVATSVGIRENHPRASAGCRCLIGGWPPGDGGATGLLFRYRRSIGDSFKKKAVISFNTILYLQIFVNSILYIYLLYLIFLLLNLLY